MNYPHIQFYVGDWLKDPELSLCSPATRGVWIDLLCRLHELNQGGKITANVQQLARLCRSSDAEVHAAITELQTTNTADISERNGVYTIICRRMLKAAELSAKRRQAGNKSAANRQQNPDTDSDSGLLKVREFARGEGISESDADWFYWKGKGNGWTNAGNPIRDWKATLRSWKRARYLPSQKQQNRTTPKPKEPAPIYDKLPPTHDSTDEEHSTAQRIAHEETEKLRAKLRFSA